MLYVLSPAKSLDYESPLPEVAPTLPAFRAEARHLVDVLREKSPQELASLMGISDTLAALNVARYQAWSPRFTARNSRPAVLAFDGDVYDGLQARTLAADDLAWAQDHVRILSGLYGVLRPLDRMQPYRLEMGTSLPVDDAPNLYGYWGDRIADHLQRALAGHPAPVVVNLASQEYFRSVRREALRARVIECVFEDWKSDGYKVISFFAKKARGLMARYAITHRIDSPRQLTSFNLEGYRHDAAVSGPDRLVFRRRITA